MSKLKHRLQLCMITLLTMVMAVSIAMVPGDSAYAEAEGPYKLYVWDEDDPVEINDSYLISTIDDSCYRFYMGEILDSWISFDNERFELKIDVTENLKDVIDWESCIFDNGLIIDTAVNNFTNPGSGTVTVSAVYKEDEYEGDPGEEVPVHKAGDLYASDSFDLEVIEPELAIFTYNYETDSYERMGDSFNTIEKLGWDKEINLEMRVKADAEWRPIDDFTHYDYIEWSSDNEDIVECAGENYALILGEGTATITGEVFRDGKKIAEANQETYFYTSGIRYAQCQYFTDDEDWNPWSNIYDNKIELVADECIYVIGTGTFSEEDDEYAQKEIDSILCEDDNIRITRTKSGYYKICPNETTSAEVQVSYKDGTEYNFTVNVVDPVRYKGAYYLLNDDKKTATVYKVTTNFDGTFPVKVKGDYVLTEIRSDIEWSMKWEDIIDESVEQAVVRIPDTVENIGDAAFAMADIIEGFEVYDASAENPKYFTDAKGVLYEKASVYDTEKESLIEGCILKAYPLASDELECVCPDDIIGVNSRAFESDLLYGDCEDEFIEKVSIKQLTFPEGYSGIENLWAVNDSLTAYGNRCCVMYFKGDVSREIAESLSWDGIVYYTDSTDFSSLQVKTLDRYTPTTSSVEMEWSAPENTEVSIGEDEDAIFRYPSYYKVLINNKTVKTNESSMMTKGLKAATAYTVQVTPSIEIVEDGALVEKDGNTSTFTVGTKAAKVSIVTPTTKSKTVTAKWKKTTCTKYEIQLAKNSKFTSGLKKATAKSSAVSYKFTKLKKGTKYYVRVRAYKTVGSKKLYGSWSSTKSIKCK